MTRRLAMAGIAGACALIAAGTVAVAYAAWITIEIARHGVLDDDVLAGAR